MKTYKEPKLYIATCTPTFRTEPPAKTPVCLYGVMCKLNVIPGYLKLPKGKKIKMYIHKTQLWKIHKTESLPTSQFQVTDFLISSSFCCLETFVRPSALCFES